MQDHHEDNAGRLRSARFMQDYIYVENTGRICTQAVNNYFVLDNLWRELLMAEDAEIFLTVLNLEEEMMTWLSFHPLSSN